MTGFDRVSPDSLNESAFRLIGKEWMLISAGTMENWNIMTASYGAFGMLWSMPVVFAFVRPQRHTFEFMEREPFFTLSFFDEKDRDVLEFWGAHSGRDTDKMVNTGVTPITTPEGSVAFKEARLVLECRKIYFQDLDPDHFLTAEIQENYPKKDYHRMFVGEVVRALKRRG